MRKKSDDSSKESRFTGADLSGKTFGRLKVINLSHFVNYNVKRGGGRWIVKQRLAIWKCLCRCGNESLVGGTSLRIGKTTSCGCFHREQVGNRARKHGRSNDLLYRRWAGMLTRCTNSNRDFWYRYGGRGISVCRKWNKFEGFCEDMAGTFSPELTLERRDNNLGYSPENCYWATQSEQANNTSKSLLLSVCGKQQTASMWASEVGLNPSTLYNRIRNGWTPEMAINTPARKMTRNVFPA